MPPTLIISTDTATFDISPWMTEGYEVYLLTHSTKRSIEDAVDDLESSQKYAILGFGRSATHALSFASAPSRRLACVIAYHPPFLPATPIHPSVRVLLHLPSSAPYSLPTTAQLHIKLYSVGDWFADPTSPTYDAAAASIAFSRTLAELRATIGPEHVDIETVWDDHISATFSGCETGVQTAGATSTLCMPTLVAGIREEQLRKFYESKVAGSPASLKMQLVNRIVGSDKIVDEMVVKFTHTCEVPWMLPGVVATGKEVEVLVVWMVMVRGGRVVHERLYWDQAGVLVQLGLIETAGLPVVDGRDCVRRVLSQR